LGGLDVDGLLLRYLNRRRDDHEAFLAALAPRELPLPGPAGWFEDRSRFLHAAFVRLHRAARHPYSPCAAAVSYDVGAREAQMRAMRRYFVREYFGEEIDFLLADKLPGEGPARPLSPCERSRARRWRALARLAALGACLDFSSRRYGWWSDVLSTIHAWAQASDRIARVYVGRLYDRRSYVMATFFDRHTSLRPVLIYQSQPMAFNLSRLHLEVPVALTSRVNLPEVEYFREQGWFKASDVRYCPHEHLIELADMQPTEPVYDIGFFASGDWARLDGRYWGPIERVRAGAFRGNPFEVRADRVLAALVDYARSRRRSLRIYLHPYERWLINEHGIQPPFRDLADGELVTIDDAPGSSRGSFHECDVAVALRSSTIWQRIDLGLDRSLIYTFGDPAADHFLAESLGPYRANLFGSVEELEAKLDRLFEHRAPRGL
jgi:hypothetical protein